MIEPQLKFYKGWKHAVIWPCEL